jgi:methionyl-tRNA synthetase
MYSYISIDDFLKLDIRIGEILSVEKIPNTDKLLKLEVDVGEGSPRQIVSGIAEYFPNPEDLVGRQAPFLINLEPRTLKGYESNGMILAVGGEGGFTLLSPSERVSNGSRVK